MKRYLLASLGCLFLIYSKAQPGLALMQPPEPKTGTSLPATMGPAPKGCFGPKTRHAIRTTATLTTDDGSATGLMGLYYYRRSYRTFSLTPEAGLAYLSYSDIDGGHGRALTLEMMGHLTLQRRIVQFRLTPIAGINLAGDRGARVGLMAGPGLSIWRFDLNVDIGLYSDIDDIDLSNLVSAGRVSLGYVFSHDNRLFHR